MKNFTCVQDIGNLKSALDEAFEIKKDQDEMHRTNEEFQKKYQEVLAQADSLPKNSAERRQKELQDMAQRQEQFQQEAYQSMQKAQQEMCIRDRQGTAMTAPVP